MSPRIIARALRSIAAASAAFALALSSPDAASAASKAATPKPAATKSSSKERASGKTNAKTDAKPSAARGPLSIGAPNRGELRDGARLRGTKHLRQREGARSWGLPPLVRMLRRAAASVAKKHQGSVLIVGDLSARRGGPIDGHNSHQSGRDVDVGFYVANSKGKPVPAKRFIPFDNNGVARDVTWARFDDARNWELVEAMLKDEEASVRYIFVASGLRARLLAYAAKKNVAKEIIARATAVLISPKESEAHDDHFHIRIACPAGTQPACSEEAVARDAGTPVASRGDAGSSAKHIAGQASAGANAQADSATPSSSASEKAAATSADAPPPDHASETPASPSAPAHGGIGLRSAP